MFQIAISSSTDSFLNESKRSRLEPVFEIKIFVFFVSDFSNN